MKNSTLLGSAVSVLLSFSVISYARTYIQDPKPAKQPNQPLVSQPNSASVTNEGADASKEMPVTPVAPKSAADAGVAAEKTIVASVVPGETYTATAYSLRGRTASGKPVSRGLIAADPRVLPLGTRVRIEAGEFSGEYVVADTGGSVRGRRVDIWTPTSREAMRFGRRAIKLTVLQIGGRRATPVPTRSRVINPTPATQGLVNQSPSTKQ